MAIFLETYLDTYEYSYDNIEEAFSGLMEVQDDLMLFQESILKEDFILHEQALFEAENVVQDKQESFLKRTIERLKTLIKTVLEKVGGFFTKMFEYLVNLKNKILGKQVPKEVNDEVARVTHEYQTYMGVLQSDPSAPDYKKRVQEAEKKYKAAVNDSKGKLTNIRGEFLKNAANWALENPGKVIAGITIASAVSKKAFPFFKGLLTKREDKLHKLESENEKLRNELGKYKKEEEMKNASKTKKIAGKLETAEGFLEVLGFQKAAQATGALATVCNMADGISTTKNKVDSFKGKAKRFFGRGKDKE